MKQKTFKSLLFLAALTAVSSSVVFTDSCSSSCDTSCKTECTDCCSGCQQSQGLWQPHSLGVSMSREILLTKPAFVDMPDNEGWFGTFGVGFEYNQNFGENDCGCCTENKDCCKSIGSLPFWGANKSNHMTVGNASGDYDLDAYQIGLGPVTTNGTITLNPRIYQTGAHFLLYFGSRKEERGFFATIGGPVGVISVDPRLCDSKEIEAVQYDAGYIATAATDAPYSTVAEAFAGGKDAGWYKGLNYAKISTCKRSSSAKFGDLAFALGYNFLADEKKHMGIAVRFSAPTGNTACAEYILDPIFGRNDHWAAGGQLMGHYKVWEADSSDKSLTIWMNATVEHLFRSNHKRTFDLADNGLGSKYLLLAKYSGTTFQNEIVNAANVSTIDIESSFGVEANFAFNFDFNLKNWDMGLTYEGWARSCEKLKVDCACADSVDLSTYGVLGRQTPTGATTDNLGQPNAKIGKSEARAAGGATGDIKDISDSANRLNSDVNTALNICGQRAGSAYTSKVLAHAGYTWKDSDYAPYLGVSGGAEFTHKDNSAVRFWNVGLRGGMAF